MMVFWKPLYARPIVPVDVVSTPAGSAASRTFEDAGLLTLGALAALAAYLGGPNPAVFPVIS